MQRSGVVVGGHGVDHEIQHHNQPRAVVEAEATGSFAALARRLDRAPVLFAYPSGQANSSSAPALASAGYRVGLTTEDGTVTGRPTEDRFALPRIEATTPACDLARALDWCP